VRLHQYHFILAQSNAIAYINTRTRIDRARALLVEQIINHQRLLILAELDSEALKEFNERVTKYGKKRYAATMLFGWMLAANSENLF
jgi:hypothetical protein